MAPPTKNRGISHGISFSTTKITLKIPTFLRYGIVGEGILICVIVQTKGTVLLVCDLTINHNFQGFFAVKRRAVFILGAKGKALVRGWRRDCVVGGMETRFQ